MQDNISPFKQEIALMLLKQMLGDSSPLTQAQTGRLEQDTAASQAGLQLDQQQAEQKSQLFPGQLEQQKATNQGLGVQLLQSIMAMQPQQFNEQTGLNQTPPVPQPLAQSLIPDLAQFLPQPLNPEKQAETATLLQRIAQAGRNLVN